MSPLYQYHCATCGHTETRLRRFEQRFDPLACKCGVEMTWLFPLPHVPPDGIYSYAPNIGTADAFERKEAKIKEREAKLAEKGG